MAKKTGTSPMARDNAEWLKRPEAKKNKYMLNVCDTFDYENYPVFVKDDKALAVARKKYDDSDQMSQIDSIVNIKTGEYVI